MDLEFLSRIAMNVAAGLLVIPAIAALVRASHHKHDVEHGKLGGQQKAFTGGYRRFVLGGLIFAGSAVILFSVIQLAFAASLWLRGAAAEGTVTEFKLAWQARGPDYYDIQYRFRVPPGHTYFGHARTTTIYTVGQPIRVKYLRENPDRNVIDDWVVTFRWPLLLLIFGVGGIVASRRI